VEYRNIETIFISLYSACKFRHMSFDLWSILQRHKLILNELIIAKNEFKAKKKFYKPKTTYSSFKLE